MALGNNISSNGSWRSARVQFSLQTAEVSEQQDLSFLPSVMADFGQSIFGQPIWPAKFGQSIFGQSFSCGCWCCRKTREPKGPGLQKHHQISTRRPPEREKKTIMGAGEGKKERHFGRSGGGRSRERAVPREGGPHNPNHATPDTHHKPHTTHHTPHTPTGSDRLATLCFHACCSFFMAESSWQPVMGAAQRRRQ